METQKLEHMCEKKLASVRYHLTERRVLNEPFESLPVVERREGLAC